MTSPTNSQSRPASTSVEVRNTRWDLPWRHSTLEETKTCNFKDNKTPSFYPPVGLNTVQKTVHIALKLVFSSVLKWMMVRFVVIWMTSLFSHQICCLKPLCGWQIIPIIRPDSRKLMAVSPLNTSSARLFSFFHHNCCHHRLRQVLIFCPSRSVICVRPQWQTQMSLFHLLAMHMKQKEATGFSFIVIVLDKQ